MVTQNCKSMRYYIFLLMMAVTLMVTFNSCGDDADCCDVTPEDTLLNYDGPNATAPNLPPGNYSFAIRLPSTLINRLAGQSLKSVNFYLYDRPVDAILVVYNEVNGRPFEAIYTQNITNAISTQGWNSINLDAPVSITGSSVWVGIDVSLNSVQQTIGCDAGPGNVNGDWLYDGADEEFRRFADRVGDSINWNIRVVIGG